MIYIYSIVAAYFSTSKVLARSRSAGGSDHPDHPIARSPDFLWVAAKDQFRDEGREDHKEAMRFQESSKTARCPPDSCPRIPDFEKCLQTCGARVNIELKI